MCIRDRFFSGIPFFVLGVVGDEVDVFHSVKVVLNEGYSIAAHFFHAITRAVQASRL